MGNIYIALENIRSLHNVGAIFRTCSFFGFYNILLVGYSGKTLNHRDEEILHEKISKTSLGSDVDLNVNFLDSTEDLLNFVRTEKTKLVAVEQSKKSMEVNQWKPSDNLVIVFGNEVEGVSNSILDEADQIVEIPCKGKHKSLNVTTACGIILQRVTN